MTRSLSAIEIAREVGLPYYVVHRWLSRNGFTAERQYPRQRRVISPDTLPAIREGLVRDGYRVADNRAS